MHGEGIVLGADSTSMLEEHLAALREKRPRVFWVGLGFALLAHVLLIVGIGSARQRTLGTPEGATDAIAVEIVDGATLKDSMELPTPATTPPAAPQPTASVPTEQPAQPEPPQPEAQPPTPAQPDVAEAVTAAAPPPAVEKEAPTLTAAELPALEDTPAEEAEAQPPTEQPKQEQPKQEPAKKETAKKPPAKQQAKQPPKKRTQTAALDLSVPFDGGSSAEPGGSSAVQRPPGITRSGENDEFARNVIRALQRSMPRERDVVGRVTVRIVLNENGSRADVKLLQSGGNPDLDFNVMFAARQTAYPFPPKNSTLVDRTFTVTYIYR